VYEDPPGLNYTPDSTLTVLQLNVEDLSKVKCTFLVHVAKEEAVDVISLHKIHVPPDRALRYLITGFVVACQHLHPKYELAIYIKHSIKSYIILPITTHGGYLPTVAA